MAYVNLMDIVYPVGSVYITTTLVSPASSIGGTWTEVTGKYLKAVSSSSDAALSTGGSDTVQGTVYIRYGAYKRNTASVLGGDDVFLQAAAANENGSNDWVNYRTYDTVTVEANANTSDNSGKYATGYLYYLDLKTTSEDNNPPYMTVHIWYRTA